MALPPELQNIVLDYAAQLEHTHRWRVIMLDLQSMCRAIKRVRLNLEFQMLFWPGWWDDLDWWNDVIH